MLHDCAGLFWVTEICQLVSGNGSQYGLLLVAIIATSGSSVTGEEPRMEGVEEEIGSAMGRGFLTEGEGPSTVTAIDAGGRGEPSKMEGMEKGGGEVRRLPFWGVRAGKLGNGVTKMAGLATLLAPFFEESIGGGTG